MANEELLKKAVEAFDALSPEQKATMLEEQRQSWVRGNVGLSRDERGITTPTMPTNTRPAAPVEGLETVRREYRWGGDPKWKVFGPIFDDEPRETRELVTRSQAEAIIAAVREAHQRLLDIIEEANTEIESSEVEKVRLENRILVLEADNSALTARVKELSEALDKQRELDNESTLHHYNRAKALETKLAAARNVLSVFLSEYDALYLFCDEPPSMVSAVEAARAALEAKP